ncbi:MAG TPA: hypothetical protein VFO85_06510, partial [Vicinamibacteria bacterium]|nr:hypothetical protein [Vicinamibacteria bacterium]
ALPPETGPAAAPTPAPTPLPLLMGPGYDTLRALAAALNEEMAHAVAGTQALKASGRPMRGNMPGVQMFARRTESFRTNVEKYRSEPFDVVGTVAMMRSRAGMLSRRMRLSPALAHTWPDWDAALDILDRMQKLLAGEKVTVPPPHVPQSPPPAPAPAPTPAATPAPSPAPR